MEDNNEILQSMLEQLTSELINITVYYSDKVVNIPKDYIDTTAIIDFMKEKITAAIV